MADQYGIDLGNAFARAEDIKAARIRNKFAEKDAQLSQDRSVMQNEMAGIELQQAQRDEGDIVTGRNARAVAGQAAGLPAQDVALLTISPTKAGELKTYFEGLKEDDRKVYEQNVEDMGKAAAYIKTAPDPEKAFIEVKNTLSPELQKQLPATYDPNFIDLALAQSLEIKDILTLKGGKKPGDAPSGYEWLPDGSGLKPIKGGPHDKAGGGGGSIETAAANGIKATVALAFGGEFNPTTGEFSIMDPGKANQMIDVIALAQEKMIADPSIAPGRAVQQALKESGVDPAAVGNAMTGGDDADPLGILGQ